MNWKRDFDWARAIALHSEALKRIIEALFTMLGLVADAVPVERIKPSLHRAVLRVLWPAESAVRRLVVVAARGLVVKLMPSRPMPKGKIIRKGGGSRPPAFRLFDTRKYFPELSQRRVKYAKCPPRILFFGEGSKVDDLWPAPPPAALAPPPDGLADARRLTRRLQALRLALDDLPKQAIRLARMRLKREKIPKLKFQPPMRPGYPPGHRRKKTHEIDDVLSECHWLAWEALKPDTS